jgi:hypothetical protein
MPATRYPLLATLLRRYFYSGWAFLIPYLAAYLLYYVTAWPVNPPAGTGSLADSPSPFAPPPLLHLYWFLHALHLILAAIALRSWWTETSAQYVRNAFDSQSAPYSSYRLPLLTRIAPWAILALIFYIPGAYLEWPSDPWEHLRRINEWRILDTVGAHYIWHKSAHFIPYSLLSCCSRSQQLSWLDFYYTGICLLLCWQYYRLSRTCGLGERTSMVFVIAQTLLFGNDVFSFYRYYGISSSIYAQLGTVAFTRIILEWAAYGRANLSRDTWTGPSVATAVLSGCPPPTTRYSLLPSICRPLKARPTIWHLPSLLWVLAAGLCLLALIAFNHIQGLAIAILNFSSVTIWILIKKQRQLLIWLISGIILTSFFVHLSYHHLLPLELYQREGWLSSWLGFNLVTLNSPARDRMIQVLGTMGLFNCFAALFLFRRNHIVAWLTMTPLIALIVPSFAVPFALAIADRDASDIITFQRMLFSTPQFLAIATLLSSLGTVKYETSISQTTAVSRYWREGGLLTRRNETANVLSYIVIVVIALLITLPQGRTGYNRTWHTLATTPSDLRLRPIWDKVSTLASSSSTAPFLMTISIPGYVAGLQMPGRTRAWGIWARHYSLTGRSPTDDPPAIENEARSKMGMMETNILLISPLTFVSSYSIASLGSNHWPAQEAVLSTFAFRDMVHTANEYGLRITNIPSRAVVVSSPYVVDEETP